MGVSCAAEDWIDRALDMPGLRLVDLSPRIAYRSTVLPASFPDDTVDRILVATAREENAAILTDDPRMTVYGHVRTFW